MPRNPERAPEWERLLFGGMDLTVPTEAEILRIKGVLILRRNATRDYLDFVALATHLGTTSTGEALPNTGTSPRDGGTGRR